VLGRGCEESLAYSYEAKEFELAVWAASVNSADVCAKQASVKNP